MASRIAGSSIKWPEIMERVPKNQVTNFNVFKAKSDGYLRRMLANPAEPPKINWADYEQKIPVAGMVKEFQSKYQALKIPYPVDTLTTQIDAQEKEIQKSVQDFVTLSNERIVSYQKEIEKINAMLPYDQMTLEDFADAHPDLALDTTNRPTMWPHTPEDQPEYFKDEETKSH